MADTFDQTREQKIQSLQHSVAFLQSQHADTLVSLHKEIEKLQKKCSALTHQLTFSKDIPSSSKGFVKEEHNNGVLQDELENYRRENVDLSSKLDGKEKRINFLEGQLRSREQKHQDDLKNVQRRIAKLENQLDSKANTIVYLTSKIQQNKNKSVNDDGSSEQITNSSGPSNIQTSFSPSPPSLLQVNPSSSKRREYNLRRSGVSPSPSKAGVIQDGSSSSRQLDFVLQNTLPKTTRHSSRHNNNNNNKHSETNTRRGEKELNFSKPKPPDYEDFLQISQPEIVQKSAIEPLPPITTRSGRQLRNSTIQQSRNHRQQAPRATTNGEVETVILDTLSSPERNLRRSLQQNSMK